MEMAFCSLCLVFTNYVFYYPGCLPFKLEGILEFPVVNGSCNKCEFSVGYSLEGKKQWNLCLGISGCFTVMLGVQYTRRNREKHGAKGGETDGT
jgi:hypothetical protein